MSFQVLQGIPAPSFLDLVDSQSRKQWQTELESVFESLNFSGPVRESVQNLIDTCCVLEELFLDQWNPEILMSLGRDLPQYLTARGTLPGLRILIEKVTGLHRFSILERSLPSAEYLLGQSRLGSPSRVFSENSKESMFIIQFDHFEYELNRMGAQDLKNLIQDELPPHLHCILNFKKKIKKKIPSHLGQFRTGEQL
jgi:hypothetical protein